MGDLYFLFINRFAPMPGLEPGRYIYVFDFLCVGKTTRYDNQIKRSTTELLAY